MQTTQHGRQCLHVQIHYHHQRQIRARSACLAEQGPTKRAPHTHHSTTCPGLQQPLCGIYKFTCSSSTFSDVSGLCTHYCKIWNLQCHIYMCVCVCRCVPIWLCPDLSNWSKFPISHPPSPSFLLHIFVFSPLPYLTLPSGRMPPVKAASSAEATRWARCSSP